MRTALYLWGWVRPLGSTAPAQASTVSGILNCSIDPVHEDMLQLSLDWQVRSARMSIPSASPLSGIPALCDNASAHLDALVGPVCPSLMQVLSKCLRTGVKRKIGA